MNRHYLVVAQRAAHRCEYCRAPEAIFNFPFEVEHIFPPAFQGLDDDSNLALACRACNLRKSDHVSGTDDQTGNSVRLFHPRQDHWEEHFEIIAETGVIHGKTPIGRATVHRLEMNSPAQQEARRQWMRLGLFP
ncbi:MAG: HNH endonuclease [Planctomycetota bacterium]|nr:MAG: HNH endonuclease [Planctomycetota bacterium]